MCGDKLGSSSPTGMGRLQDGWEGAGIIPASWQQESCRWKEGLRAAGKHGPGQLLAPGKCRALLRIAAIPSGMETQHRLFLARGWWGRGLSPPGVAKTGWEGGPGDADEALESFAPLDFPISCCVQGNRGRVWSVLAALEWHRGAAGEGKGH